MGIDYSYDVSYVLSPFPLPSIIIMFSLALGLGRVFNNELYIYPTALPETYFLLVSE